MPTLKSERNGEKLTVWLPVRLDFENNEAVKAEIDAMIEEPTKELVFDASEMIYISSIGLRIILAAIKRIKKVSVINLSQDAHYIMTSAGFDNLIPISLAMREQSIDGAKVIGSGYNSTVYRINHDTIVKVYKDVNSLDKVEKERELAQKAFLKGVPTAISYDVVKVGERYGLVFEMLDAGSLYQVMYENQADLPQIIKKYAAFIKSVNEVEFEPDELPSIAEQQKGWLEDIIAPNIPASITDFLRKLLASIPEGHGLIHGDLQPNNIILGQEEMYIIDMDAISLGDSVFELAGIYNFLMGFSVMKKEKFGEGDFDYPMRQKIWDMLIAAYYEGKDAAEIEKLRHRAEALGKIKLLRWCVNHNADEFLRQEIERTQKYFAEIGEGIFA